MDAFTGYISAHPTVLVIGIVLIVIIVLNFIFKSMLKLLVGLLIVAIVAFGYFYLKNPNDMPDSAGQPVKIMKSSINQIRDKSKGFVEEGRDLYKKTKNAPKDVGKMLDSSKKDLDKEFKKE